MKKLYRENELGFALMWLGIYCIGRLLPVVIDPNGEKDDRQEYSFS